MSDPRSFGSALVRAWRSLRRTPGFFAIGVASLAIALGLATTVIAQIDALMNPYVSLRNPEELFRVEMRGMTRTQPAVGEVAALLRTSSAVAGVASAEMRGREWVHAGTRSAMGAGLAAPREFFDLVGARIRIGRLFDPNETTQSGVVIVSDEFWRRHFGNRTTLDSATLTFGDGTYRIVGVLAPHTSIVAWSGDIWFPKAHTVFTKLEAIVVRLKPGATRTGAEAAFGAVAEELERRHGVYARRPHFVLYSLAPDPLGLGEFHRALIGAAVFILLIACANVSALMLARTVAKRRDYALRLALGASRADILRDVAAEVTILAAFGGVAGVLIAQWTMHIMTTATPPELAWFGFLEARWNLRIFVGMLAVVGLAIGLAAIVPALHVARVAPADPLKEGSAASTGRPSRRFQILVAGELALAMVLLFGASLITKTASRVAAFDFGYEARGLTRVSGYAQIVRNLDSVAMKFRRVPPSALERITFLAHAQLEGIAQRVRALPGVRDASWTVDNSIIDGVIASDAPEMGDSILFMPQTLAVGSGFFATLGIPIVRGRDFVAGDLEGRGAVILDELSARLLFPGGDAVGRLVRMGRARWMSEWTPVVGIVRSVRLSFPADPAVPAPPVVYVTRPQGTSFSFSVVVRPTPDVADITPSALRVVSEHLPPRSEAFADRWLRNYETMLTARRFIAGIFITLSVASLVLAGAGLFGVLSYAARQRNREFAVRIALGAQRQHVVGLVFHDAAVMALGGTAIGAVIAFWAAFAVYGWLWGVYPVDVGALLATEGILFAIAMVATALPALRAARANPVDVMRAT